jgi:hypothetical protein
LVAAAPLALALPLPAGWRRVLIQAGVIVALISTAVGLAYHSEPIDWKQLLSGGEG